MPLLLVTEPFLFSGTCSVRLSLDRSTCHNGSECVMWMSQSECSLLLGHSSCLRDRQGPSQTPDDLLYRFQNREGLSSPKTSSFGYKFGAIILPHREIDYVIIRPSENKQKQEFDREKRLLMGFEFLGKTKSKTNHLLTIPVSWFNKLSFFFFDLSWFGFCLCSLQLKESWQTRSISTVPDTEHLIWGLKFKHSSG